MSTAGSFSRATASVVNARRRDDARRQFLDNALTTADVQRLLQVRTPQAVHRLRSRGKLLGRQIGNATWFPAWQFHDGERRADLDAILAALARFSADAIAADRVMRLQRDELGGRSIAECLDRPRKRAVAWSLLQSVGG